MTILLQYAAKIATQGDMRIVIIPKEKHEKIRKFVGEQVKITIETL